MRILSTDGTRAKMCGGIGVGVEVSVGVRIT
jgi:hypothetical protein